MIPQYNNIHQQTQYMHHPQYMQQTMPMYNDNMASSIPYNSGNPGSNQMPPNRLTQQQQSVQQPQQMHQLQQQQQLNQSHQQQMIDTTKYSNHSNHYPFAGNPNYFYHGGNSSNNNVNKKN